MPGVAVSGGARRARAAQQHGHGQAELLLRGAMEPISDDYMRERLAKAKTYTLVLLRITPKRREAGADAIVWEHGRRNFSLREQGLLPIVCPVTDDSGWAGMGLFDVPPDEVVTIMDADPGVQAGIFSYEVHPVLGFPGSCLPG
jgi:hypothetical protein